MTSPLAGHDAQSVIFGTTAKISLTGVMVTRSAMATEVLQRSANRLRRTLLGLMGLEESAVGDLSKSDCGAKGRRKHQSAQGWDSPIRGKRREWNGHTELVQSTALLKARSEKQTCIEQQRKLERPPNQGAGQYCLHESVKDPPQDAKFWVKWKKMRRCAINGQLFAKNKNVHTDSFITLFNLQNLHNH